MKPKVNSYKNSVVNTIQQVYIEGVYSQNGRIIGTPVDAEVFRPVPPY